jgi:hypothetical protein
MSPEETHPPEVARPGVAYQFGKPGLVFELEEMDAAHAEPHEQEVGWRSIEARIRRAYRVGDQTGSID